ncbi:MAG: TonB-dependent receptor plug domain-containing protein [Oceanobacter sp.]
MIRLSIPLYCGCFLIALPTAADEPSDSHHHELPNVVSYGQQEPLPDTGLTVLTREQFAVGSTQVSDVLEHVNGLQLQPLGGLGDPTLVSIRGASGQQTRLLIDGVEVNQGQYGSYDLNALPLNRVERIEILSASADMSYGLSADQAIGGTINLITADGSSHTRHASASIGSWGTANISMDAPLWRSDNNRYRTQVWYEHQRSDNNYDYPVASPENDPTQQNRLEPLRNAEYHRNSLTLTQATPWAETALTLQEEHKGQPSYHRNPKDNNAALDNTSGELKITGTPASLSESVPVSVHWQLFHNRRNESFKDPQGVVGLGVDDDRYQYRHSQANLSAVLYPEASSWQAGIGAQLSHQTYQSEYREDSDSQECSTLQGNCDTFSWLDRLQWLAQTNWQNDDDSAQFQFSAQHTREQRGQRKRTNQQRKSSASQAFPTVQVNWRQTHDVFDQSEWQWRISYKRTTRSPTLYEQFGDHGFIVGSPELKPELSRSVSLEQQLSTELLTLPTQLELTGFQRKLEDAIFPEYDTRGVGRYKNLSQATLHGVEWRWQQTLPLVHNQWSWSFSGSHYRSNTDSPHIKNIRNKQLPGIYHTRFLGSLSWQSSPLTTTRHRVQLQMEWADDLYTGAENVPAQQADLRDLINASYQYQHQSGSAGLRIHNLVNQRFNDYTDRPARPRQWTLFINHQF